VDEIVIVDYDPKWPRLFAEEQRDILQAAPESILQVEHIGSTAVPGLAAKPIVDLMARSRTVPLNPQSIHALAGIGYEDLGEHGIPGRHFFRKGQPRSFHLHVVADYGVFWNRHLHFRDYLRSHPDAAADYADVKRELATQFGGNREAYTEAKTTFIEEILRRME
jgi:GrpB-like predicted nucleotidyltransferase (UPF0157 family)